MSMIKPTKTEKIVLSILSYAGASYSAEDVLILADYIADHNEREVKEALSNVVRLNTLADSTVDNGIDDYE